MTRRFNLIPYSLFILSGACGLVYEVTWARHLALFLGYTTLAHMCVLAAFMGGLAFGSIWIGRMTSRFRRPLAAYGVLEVGIGLYAILSPFIIAAVQRAVLSTAVHLHPGTTSWLALKLVASVAVLILPTFLMGGTFPVLMRHFQPRTTSEEDKSEWLYLVNCVGAVVGALLAGFLLIPQLGLQFALIGIGAINVVIGLAAVLFAYLDAPVESAKRAAEETSAASRHPFAVPVYITIGVSGLAAMVYELVWIRMYAVTLGSSTYSFTLMLSAFISGIALGSLAVGLIPKLRANPLLSLAIAEVAIGLTVLLGIPAYARMPYLFLKWTGLLARTPEAFGLLNVMKYSLCFLMMVVPTFFSGMTLPLAIKAVSRRDEQIGNDSGLVYGANTMGTLAGSILAGLVLIPFLGLRHSLELAVLVNIVAGVMLLWMVGKLKMRVASVAVVLASVALVVVMPAWHPLSLVRGAFRDHGTPPRTWKEFSERYQEAKVLFYKEDGDCVVAVVEVLGTSDISLMINGKAEASAIGDRYTQSLVSQIPLFLKPDSRDILVVGLGSGITVSSALTHPGTTADCVEISPAVAESMKCFDEANGRLRTNPRFNLIIEDARTHVLTTPKKYDLVINEPSNPWIAGVGNLFTKEYYESADKALKPGGLMVQWLQTYELSDELATMVLRTMHTVFPYIYVFAGGETDTILVGSHEPLQPDFEAMEQRLQVKSVKQELDSISIDSVAALLGRQMLTPDIVTTLVEVQEGMINSDEYPFLEYMAPECQFLSIKPALFAAMDQRTIRGESLFVHQYLRDKPLDKATVRSLIRSYSDLRVVESVIEYPLLKYYVSQWNDDQRILNRYAAFAVEFDTSKAMGMLTVTNAGKPDAAALGIRADALAEDLRRAHSVYTPQDFLPALRLLDEALRNDPDNRALALTREQVVRLAR